MVPLEVEVVGCEVWAEVIALVVVNDAEFMKFVPWSKLLTTN